ncbi:DNA-3-methyladenine glycosylase II [Pseudomonas delhiensis]|uniref:DNA-3-methyladenine glycosylase II n=2 Tax=Pseudomonas delhiensis TaxID=366289 RepID=A0A239ND89_9PSED|nr:DNA-3-methyladenine glycosylase II [Pseudomonas delhiensis]SNT52384.1 DNA-3-methyladenine glycosylase II [Pseudomonas delhiensis]
MVSAMNTAIAPLVLHLPYQPPWDWRQFHEHFALRRLAGVETLGEAHYRRSLRLDGVPGWMDIRPLAGEPALRLELHLDGGAADSAPLAERVRKMFDLDSDPRAVAAHLGADPLLRPLVEAWPGLRLPCAFDPFEQAVRAIVGQQVTVKAAVTITGRLVQRLGQPLGNAVADGPQHLFPTPRALAEADLAGIGMPGKRVASLQRFAAAVAEGALELHVDDGAEALVKRLCELPGIGPWTAEYVALRAFGEADAFPAADLGLLKSPVWGEAGIAARDLQRRAEAWRPWRAYAAVYLWQAYSQGSRIGG